MFNKFYKGKRVLITGSSGFKGSWLAIWLKHLGAEVAGYSLPPVTDMDNFIICGVSKMINQKNDNIKDLASLKSFIQKFEPEIVFHLAAQPLVMESYANPVENFATNVMGTVNLMEAIRHTASVNVCINVTTDKVYKNDESIWGFRENDELAGKDPYSASKSCSEIITSSYNYAFLKEKGVKVATARAGNVIGGGDWAENRIVPDFFRAVQNGNDLVIRNPRATRPWQHVLESLSGYLTLAKALHEDEKFAGAWNFGPNNNYEAYSVGELIGEFQKFFPAVSVKKPEIQQTQKEAHLLKLDISKAVTYLNWNPILSFEQTVSFTQKGYMADISGDKIIKNRLAQIESFMNLAK